MPETNTPPMESRSTEGSSTGSPARKAIQENLDAMMLANRTDHFVRRGDKIFAGTHLIVEVMEGTGLDCESRIQQAFRQAATLCGATLLHIHTHKFSPQGITGVAVLAESHITVHTWPEIGYGAFDVFMCGDSDPWKAVEVFKKSFETQKVTVRELMRGAELLTPSPQD